MCTFSPQEEARCTPPTENPLQLRAVVGLATFAYSRIPALPLYHIQHRMSRAPAEIHKKSFSHSEVARSARSRACATRIRRAAARRVPLRGAARQKVQRACVRSRLRARSRAGMPAPLSSVRRCAFVLWVGRWGRGHCAGVRASTTGCGSVPPALR